MANFNTYQTRNLYVVNSFLNSGEPDAAGELAMGTTATGEVFFKYFNGDGQATRTDIIYPKNIASLKKTTAAEMDIPLKKHTITLKTDVASSLANYVGKEFGLVVTFHEVGSYDWADVHRVAVSVPVTSATATDFYKSLAEALAIALPDRKYPLAKVFSNGSEVTKAVAKAGNATGAAAGVILVEVPQGYRRGLKSCEAYPFTLAFHVHGINGEEIQWGVDTVADSNISGNTIISGTYGLADLEMFSMGERGDQFRGYAYPNNYEPTPLIDLSKKYDVVTVEYFWQGSAENVQKSPRMIQFACEISGSGSQATSDANSIYDALAAAMAGVASS